MDAVDYLKTRLQALESDNTTLADKVFQTRAPQSDDKGGVPLPSIIWRQDAVNGAAVGIDGATAPAVKMFEIECRSSLAENAGMMAKTVLEYLSPELSHVLADYDEPDDPSQEVGGYFSHIVVVGINNHV